MRVILILFKSWLSTAKLLLFGGSGGGVQLSPFDVITHTCYHIHGMPLPDGLDTSLWVVACDQGVIAMLGRSKQSLWPPHHPPVNPAPPKLSPSTDQLVV